MDEWQPDWEASYQNLHCFSLNVNHEILDPQRIRNLKSSGTPLLAYTVNEPARAADLLSWGVNAIFTDCPGQLLASFFI
jgi:glycerophosphoryl diester phosphodiesterase